MFPEEVESRECDLLSPDIGEKLPRLLQGCQSAVHIATAIPHDRQAAGAWETNSRLRTEGTRSLLNASIQAGVSVYIQQSITLAYPDCGDKWITEETLLDAGPQRARTNTPVIAMEAMVRDTPVEKLRWVILRCGTFVGKGTDQEQQVNSLLAGTASVSCDGRNFVSLVNVKDVAAAFAAVLKAQPAGEIFNINAEPLRQGDYLDQLAERLGASRPPRNPNLPCPPSIRSSSEKARVRLGWVPREPLYP
jgi:nucleoside-diphosphate-sugar epimerase